MATKFKWMVHNLQKLLKNVKPGSVWHILKRFKRPSKCNQGSWISSRFTFFNRWWLKFNKHTIYRELFNRRNCVTFSASNVPLGLDQARPGIISSDTPCTVPCADYGTCSVNFLHRTIWALSSERLPIICCDWTVGSPLFFGGWTSLGHKAPFPGGVPL